MSTPSPLARLLADPRVIVAEMDPREVVPEAELFPEEAALVARAVLSRRQQFAAGRRLARLAWQQLGQAPAPLLSDSQRVPVWPPGLVGTITHTHVWCAAAVARASEVGGLGADVESSTPLEPALWERICRPEERALLRALPPERAGLLAKAIFSAKESIYKALYPRTRVFLDFQGMSIELEPCRGEGQDAGELHEQEGGHGDWRWRARLCSPWAGFAPGERFAPGRLHIDERLITTAVLL